MGLLATASVAIDDSKFTAVNNRDKNFTKGKVERRRAQLEESVARYLAQLDTVWVYISGVAIGQQCAGPHGEAPPCPYV